jgi:hypothetical protein
MSLGKLFLRHVVIRWRWRRNMMKTYRLYLEDDHVIYWRWSRYTLKMNTLYSLDMQGPDWLPSEVATYPRRTQMSSLKTSVHVVMVVWPSTCPVPTGKAPLSYHTFHSSADILRLKGNLRTRSTFITPQHWSHLVKCNMALRFSLSTTLLAKQGSDIFVSLLTYWRFI